MTRRLIADFARQSQVAEPPFPLDLRDRAQAVVLAYESGLVTPAGSEK